MKTHFRMRIRDVSAGKTVFEFHGEDSVRVANRVAAVWAMKFRPAEHEWAIQVYGLIPGGFRDWRFLNPREERAMRALIASKFCRD